MSDWHAETGTDRMLAATLSGMAMHHARWRPLTEAETATAVAGLRELADGRADLLAEQAGLSIGHSKDAASEPLGRCAAELLIRAGADLDLVPQWIEDGRRRRGRPRT